MEIEFTKRFGKKLISVAMSQPGTAKILADDIGETLSAHCQHLMKIMANCHEEECDSFTVIIKANISKESNE